MFPIIFEAGPIVISTLGVTTFLGFILACFMLWRRGKEEGLDEEMVMDLCLQTSIFIFLGGRIAYILVNWREFSASWLGIFDIVGKPGYYWLGSLLGGTITLWIFCSRRKVDFFKIADMGSFSIVTALIFIRVGLFFDGSGYGRATDWFWGIKFPGLEDRRHPVQLLEAGLLLIILKLLHYFEKNYRTFEWYKEKRGEAAPGFVFLSLVVLGSGLVFVVEFFKDNVLYWNLLSRDQGVAIGLMVVGLTLLYTRSGFEARKTKRRKISKMLHLKTGHDVKE